MIYHDIAPIEPQDLGSVVVAMIYHDIAPIEPQD
jgi:hypothetical protein